MRGSVLKALALAPSQLLVSFHTPMRGPSLYREDVNKPGGALIAAYLTTLGDRIISVARAALTSRRPVRLSWRYGRCDLARNRDLPEPGGTRHLVGYNPTVNADDTLLVGRVEDAADSRILAGVVNYACHPTTLAWENRLVSPDFPGAMREVIESRTGAPLAAEQSEPPARSTASCGNLRVGTLPLKSLPPIWEVEAARRACADRAQSERLWRQRGLRRMFGEGTTLAPPVWVWRMGEAVAVAGPSEAYSALQTGLRGRFPDRPIAVLNVTNGYVGYLPPRENYTRDQYSVWASPFAAGGLEALVQGTGDWMAEALGAPVAASDSS